MNENFKMKGHLRIFKNENGIWSNVVDKDNLIVNVGKEYVMDKIFTGATGSIAFFSVGSSLTTANATDTNLLNKIDITSAAVPHKIRTSIADSGTNITMQFDLTSTEPVTQPASISEFGTFSLVSGGSMFSRVVHTPITKNSEVELRYFYDVEVQS
jgi:hypothetical protein